MNIQVDGLGEGIATLLHVWGMEDSTKQSLLVEVMALVEHLVTCGCWM